MPMCLLYRTTFTYPHINMYCARIQPRPGGPRCPPGAPPVATRWTPGLSRAIFFDTLGDFGFHFGSLGLHFRTPF